MVRPDPGPGLPSGQIGYAPDMGSGTERVGVADARAAIARGDAVAIDVRSEDEWSAGHVPGATHLPDGDLGAAAERPEDGARLMVIAKDAGTAAEAASRLGEHGYEAVAVDGDMDDWSDEDFNVQPTEDPDEDTELGAS
jgi:rhodanese-related sulfurtransferase